MKRIALFLKKYTRNLTYLCVLCFLFFVSNQLNAQVGINNTDPKASLDITATNASNPTNTDGLLVPRVSAFPSSDPGSDQNGMLLYLTTTLGLNTPGFYYWNQPTSSWLKVTDSSVNSSDADFYEEGTTTAPDDINDDIYTQGNVAIGKNTADYPLDITSTLSNRSLNLYNGLTTGIAYGIFNELAGAGNFSQNGVWNNIVGTGNGSKLGVRNYINNDGNGNKYGVLNEVDGDGSGAFHYGVYNSVIGDGSGLHFGVYNTLSGDGSGSRRIGISNNVYGSGTGDFEGTYNSISGSGTGNYYGTRNQINSSTFLSTYGVHTRISGGANGSVYGEWLEISTIGNGFHYGNYLYLTGSGTGNKYGLYNRIYDGAGGNHYGVYSEVLKPGTNYAGYFLGNVSIGTTTSNNYIFPASRGTNNQIMQTDGSGNVSWVDSSSLGDHDFYEIGGTNAPNDITDDIFTQGRMALGSTTISNSNAVLQATKTGPSYIQITSESNGVAGLNLERLGTGQDFSLFSTGTLGTDILSFTRSNTTFNGWTNDFYLDENGEFTIAAVSAELDNKVGIGISMIGFSENNKVTIKGYGSDATTSALKIKNVSDTDLLNIRDNGLITIGSTTTGYTFPISRGTNNQMLQTNGSGTLSWVDIPNQDLEDADGDTKIQVEESGDEDKIRFDVKGTEYIVMEENQYNHFRMDIKDSKNNIFLGNNSGVVNGLGAINATQASWNIGIGGNTLATNRTGYQNIAIGRTSLQGNVSGNNNVALGHHTFSNGGNGFGNVAIGSSSSQLNVGGSYNVTIGAASDNYNTGGSNNVIIGRRAGSNNTNHSKSGSVMIGYEAGYNETNSNRLYIENSDAIAPLIYGEFDNDIMRINGELQISYPSINGYAFPTADGSNNQILQTDGSGQLNWVSPTSGDITGVTAGNGLTGGGTTGNITVHVGATNGLSVGADNVSLGGTLTQNTTINHGAFNFNYNLNSSGDFKVQDAGVDVFEVRNNGFSYFGSDTYWKDVNTAGTNIAALIDDGDDGRFILYEDGSTSVDLDANTGFVFNEQGLDRDFRIESEDETNLFRVDAANNRIGIMDSAPSFDIHLKQSTTTQAGAGGIGLESSSTTNTWKIYHSGSHISFSENGVRRGYITAGTGAYVPTSDRRLKKNITEVESVLEKVNNLKAFRYLYKDQDFSDKKTLGFMAQEVQPLFPELVEQAEDGYYGLNYAGFGVVAIKAIQEQQKEIDNLRKENETLKEKQKSLEDRLQKIERYLNK